MTIAEQPPVSSRERLACSGVTVRFGGIVAVSDATLTVGAGEVVGLIGPNGAGKSTLFGVLSGLLRPASGTVAFDGTDITRMSSQRRAKLGLARTFQHPELFAGLTVRDHLVLAYRAKRAAHRTWSDLLTMGSLRPSSADERSTVDGLLEVLDLQLPADRLALGLPLGVSRLVELGRALAAAPTVLLLDEPSSGLDATETDHFEEVVRQVSAERDISVLLVEHDVELVMRMCSRVHVLEFGRMIACGTPAEVRADPAVRAAYLGEAKPQQHAVSAPPDGGAPEERRRPTPTALVHEPSVPPLASSTAAGLTVSDLCVTYGPALALKDVSFTVAAGDVVAVLGPNGAGKSSLARAVSGLVTPASGHITLGDQDISGWSPHAIRNAGVVLLPEGRGVFRTLTVTENLRLSQFTTDGRAARKAAVESAFDIFPALAERRSTVAGALSGGEQQMLSLARALATSPRLVIADEMSLGLAPKMVDLVFEGLDRMRRTGVTVLMIEQYVHRALDFADSCLLLQRGHLAHQGAARDASSEVLRHYLGEAVASTG